MASDDGYKVGYRNPPKETRFKKGQSGNPKGRRRRKTTVEEIYREVFGEVMEVRVDGKVKRMTALELGFLRLKQDIVSGTSAERHRAFKQLREYLPDLRLDDPDPVAKPRKVSIEIIRSDGNGRPLILTDEEIADTLERRQQRPAGNSHEPTVPYDPLDD